MTESFDHRRASTSAYRRVAPPGPFFFTVGLREPRGSVRFALGGRFLRASRFNFLRSILSLILRVFMVWKLFAPCLV